MAEKFLFLLEKLVFLAEMCSSYNPFPRIQAKYTVTLLVFLLLKICSSYNSLPRTADIRNTIRGLHLNWSENGQLGEHAV